MDPEAPRPPPHDVVRPANSPSNGSSTPTSSAHGSSTPSNPSPKVRAKRRSLSQENALVATRLARAFLTRELGEVFARRLTSGQRKWEEGMHEQRELRSALMDGDILCR